MDRRAQAGDEGLERLGRKGGDEQEALVDMTAVGGQQIPLADGGWLAQAPSALPHLASELAPAAPDAAGPHQVQADFVAPEQRAVPLLSLKPICGRRRLERCRQKSTTSW